MVFHHRIRKQDTLDFSSGRAGHRAAYTPSIQHGLRDLSLLEGFNKAEEAGKRIDGWEC
jgi:hypothetical protein